VEEEAKKSGVKRKVLRTGAGTLEKRAEDPKNIGFP
jgi:hypothetical protein